MIFNRWTGEEIGELEIGPGADLSDANLRDADLRGANLRDADLRDANLLDADLSSANLSSAYLRGAYLRGASYNALSVLQAYWNGDISPALCAVMMAFDRECHPHPEAFQTWANGGECPLYSSSIQRALMFNEKPELYNHSLAAPSPWALWVMIAREFEIKI